MLVCSGCFNDKELIEFINSSGRKQPCEVCNSENESVLELDELLDFFQELLSNFQATEEGDTLSKKIQKDWKFFSSNKSADIILQEVINYVEIEPSLNDKVDYADDILESINYWGELKQELKLRKRFFPDHDRLKDLEWDSFFNLSYCLSSSTKLYRGRIHHKTVDGPYKPKEMMSPSPQDTKNGRANPFGIPFLYLSESQETVVYEVRASYLDELSIGVFEPKDSGIKIVDFSERDLLFQPDMVNHVIKSQLLRDLVSLDLSKPMRRYDSELEYIPTQFICEFIKVYTGANGIRFNSSLHKGGKNLVIFDENEISCKVVSLSVVTKVDLKFEEK